MYKVVCPVEMKDGGTYWMRLGSGFDNKDNSINLILNAFPVGQKEVKLQIREITEDEIRERAEKRSQFQARTPARADGRLDYNGLPTATAAGEPLPF
jgi:hypothetical protein